MRTSRGITRQQEYELAIYLEKLEAGAATSSDLIPVLLTFREYRQGQLLRDWTDSAAHRTRDRGQTAFAGARLWAELFSNEFESQVSVRAIPSPLFDALITVIEQDYQNDAGVRFDLLRFYPHGCSAQEIIGSLRFMYREDKRKAVYRLISRRGENPDDLGFVEWVLADRLWAVPPLRFHDLQKEIVAGFRKLLGRGARTIEKRKDLLALDFLCAFHLTEIRMGGTPRRIRCYLTVDSTASGHLCLSLALYEKEHAEWDHIQLRHDDRGAENVGSHPFSRPYLVTALKEEIYLASGARNAKVWGRLFESAVNIEKKGGHFQLARAK